jgi:hypothetical protein
VFKALGDSKAFGVNLLRSNSLNKINHILENQCVVPAFGRERCNKEEFQQRILNALTVFKNIWGFKSFLCESAKT